MKTTKWLIQPMLSIVLCLTMWLTFVPLTANATNATVSDDMNVWIGGVKITQDNAGDVFGDGKVTYHAETGILTLSDYTYEGEGYHYGSYEDTQSGETELYTAVIYSEGSLTVKLEGNSVLNNTFNDSSVDYYGDGVVAEGSITFIGDGNVNIFGSYAIYATEDVTIDGSNIHINTTDDAISAVEGDVTIKNNAITTIKAACCGIYAGGGVKITDSTVSIETEVDGIYAYDGSVVIDSTKTSLSAYGPWLDGTKVSIKADGDYGIFAYAGLIVDEKLTVSVPENSSIGELTEEDYTYGTVVDEDGAAAMEIAIEPLGYTVNISGLSMNMSVLVPTGQSINEAYCEMYGVEDFSQIMDTEKDGYAFGGLYIDEACTNGNEYDFDNPVTADITIYAKWIPVTNGGETGADGVGISSIEKTSAEGSTDTYTITLTNGNTYSFTVTNGTDGKDGIDGKDGKDGEDGKDGKDGENGADGKDGITPQLRINSKTNEWEVSYDSGKTWTSLSVKATGDKGEQGEQGIQGEKGDKGDTGAPGADGRDGVDGKDSANGLTLTAIAISCAALASNIALIAYALIKKKKEF